MAKSGRPTLVASDKRRNPAAMTREQAIALFKSMLLDDHDDDGIRIIQDFLEEQGLTLYDVSLEAVEYYDYAKGEWVARTSSRRHFPRSQRNEKIRHWGNFSIAPGYAVRWMVMVVSSRQERKSPAMYSRIYSTVSVAYNGLWLALSDKYHLTHLTDSIDAAIFKTVSEAWWFVKVMNRIGFGLPLEVGKQRLLDEASTSWAIRSKFDRTVSTPDFLISNYGNREYVENPTAMTKQDAIDLFKSMLLDDHSDDGIRVMQDFLEEQGLTLYDVYDGWQ